jgi:hypothetical protein
MRPEGYAPRPAVMKWLLDSDPAIRWQIMRDFTDEAPNAIEAVRARVATEGWGRQLLACQSRTGKWGGRDRGLLVTLWSLVVLKDLGLDHGSKQAREMIGRVERLAFKWFDKRPFFHGEVEPCINGRILGLGAYFKEPNDGLAKQLLSEQLEDGSWKCKAPQSRRSSFNPTICVLEGLIDYERAGRKSAAVIEARKKAENYLLGRCMFRSPRTGEVFEKRCRRRRPLSAAQVVGTLCARSEFCVGTTTQRRNCVLDMLAPRLRARNSPRIRDSGQEDLKSATIQAAPVIRVVRTNSDQLKCAFGWAIRRGTQTSTPKSASMSVIRRIASLAWRLMRMATAASPNATVVTIAQNIWLGGIHLGTRSAVSRGKSIWPSVNEIAQTPSPRRASRPNATALAAFASVAAYRAIAPQSKEKNRKKLPP